MNVYRTVLAIVSILIWTPFLRAQMPRMEQRFEGLIADAFMSDDGSKLWTAEDGGRVRFRDGSSPWIYLDTPDDIQNTIRAIHFLPAAGTGSWSNLGNLSGWIVGDDRVIYYKPDGGMNWVFAAQVSQQISPPSYTSHLRDIHFVRNPAFVNNTTNLTGMLGILVGLHGMWRSTDGLGSDFGNNPIALVDQGGNPINLASIELYAVDILQCGSNEPIIVACAEPGLVFRNKSFPSSAQWGTVMELVWDVRDQSQNDLSVCGSDGFYNKIHKTPPHRVEPWDIEFHRKCDGPPLLVMVAGGESLGGSAFSSTDLGKTFVKECHECEVAITCTGNSDYDLTGSRDRYKRHNEFNHLYGVAVFGDGSATAGGYGGQHVVRRTDGVWEDRSQQGFWALEMMSEDPSFMLLNGAVSQRTPGSTSSNGKAFMGGQGGQGRSTTAANSTTPVPLNPAGQPQENWKRDWTAGEQSGWWRMEATAFNTFQQGRRTGQNYHVAITTNGGLDWGLEHVLPHGYHFFFRSIAISPSAIPSQGSGVAVGQADPRELEVLGLGCTKPFWGQPKILRRAVVQGGIKWIEPTSITWLSTAGAAGKELRDVTRAAIVGTNEVYWTCGQGETLLRSLDNGANWIQFPYPSGSAVSEFNALAFVDQDKGFIVGKDPASGKACAYAVDASATPLTYDISPAAVELFDVVFHAGSNTAYAVGTVSTASGIRGRVFSSTLNGLLFDQFAPLTSQPTLGGVEPCNIGDVLGAPPLSSIALATNGDVWVGGECGRVWRLDSTGNWEPIKSQTDRHILDLAAAPDAYVYATSMRANLTGPGLVRWNPGSQ